MIVSKFIGVALQRPTPIHDPQVHRAGNAIKIESTAEASLGIDSISTSSIFLHCLENDDLKSDYKACKVLLFYWALDTTVATSSNPTRKENIIHTAWP